MLLAKLPDEVQLQSGYWTLLVNVDNVIFACT